MAAYTYFDNVYFNNITDKPNEHNNNLILNQIQYMYITPTFKFTEFFLIIPKHIC